jgi:hypothetical protein
MQDFKAGDVVRHKVSGARMAVIRSLKRNNRGNRMIGCDLGDGTAKYYDAAVLELVDQVNSPEAQDRIAGMEMRMYKLEELVNWSSPRKVDTELRCS